MINSLKITTDKNQFNLIVRLVFLFSFLFFSLTSLVAGERDEMDKILQKELGFDSSKTPAEDNNKSQDKKNEPINPVEERYRREEESSSLLWTLVKVILVFGILTAAMYYVLKFISKNRQNMYPVRDVMRVLASLPLAPNKQIQIVDVARMLLVVGVSDGSVSLIKEIDSSDIKEKIYHSRETNEPQSENFLEVFMGTFKNLDFKSAIGSKNQKDTEVNDEEIMDEIKLRQLERLEKLKNDRVNLSGRKGNKSSDNFS